MIVVAGIWQIRQTHGWCAGIGPVYGMAMSDGVLNATGHPTGRRPLSYHLRRTFVFAVPIMIARSAILIMSTVDTIMTGWSSARELAYLGLGAAPMITLMIVSIGALQATVVLVAQAVGAGEDASVGDIWRASLLHGLAFGVLVVLVAMNAEDVYLATGQDPVIAHHAAAVSWAFALGIPGMLLFMATNFTLEAIGRPRVGMVIMLAANIVNVAANGVFVLGWGGLVEPGGAAAAIATSSALRWSAFLAATIYIVVVATGDDDRYGIIAPFAVWRRQWVTAGAGIGRRIRRIGLPMALVQGVESGAFAAVVFIAGHLGPAVLAAHQATATIISLVFMNAIGMAGATSIRVGRAVGRGGLGDVRLAGAAGTGLAAMVAFPFSVIALSEPSLLARIFVDEPAVVAVATGTMWTIGWLFCFDAMMGATLGALRGTGDVWVPFCLQATAFWGLGVPASWLFAVRWELGAPGLWWGVGVGIIASLVLLLPRFHVVSRRPIARA